jgi:hypothetical protein
MCSTSASGSSSSISRELRSTPALPEFVGCSRAESARHQVRAAPEPAAASARTVAGRAPPLREDGRSRGSPAERVS